VIFHYELNYDAIRTKSQINAVTNVTEHK
jgi:hypothetical protein